MNKFKASLAISALLLSGLGLTACGDDEPQAPGTVEETSATPWPTPSSSASSSAKPRKPKHSASAIPNELVPSEFNPDCPVADRPCRDILNGGTGD